MRKIELLAPAGDLDKLKLALTYGADAVYIGGKSFSLRYFASNFTLDNIKEGVEFAHKLNKKVYVATNMVMHKEDEPGLLDYLKSLKDMGVDAVIASSLYILKLAKTINLEVHMSTQLSTLNVDTVNLFYKLGSPRIVLGRELTLEEIREIKANTEADIEVFIHGGMCSSYSGKCMLSNYMASRDPNRGGCAHSCRWKYFVYQNERQIGEENEYISMSSKDLVGIEEVPYLIESGVGSLKIEGRMKSYNYLAYIISAYRKAIDDYYEKNGFALEEYKKLLYYGENREAGHGFFYGNVTRNESQLELMDKFSKAGEFIGIIRGKNPENSRIIMEVKNKILTGQDYLVLSPGGLIRRVKIDKMFYKDNEVDVFTVAGENIEIIADIDLQEFDLIHI